MLVFNGLNKLLILQLLSSLAYVQMCKPQGWKIERKDDEKICQVSPSLHCIGQGQSFVSVRTNRTHRQLGQPVF